MTQLDFTTVLPEFILAVFALAALMFGSFMGKDKAAVTLLWATALIFVLLAGFIGLAGGEDRVAFGGMFINDGFARFAKVIILLSSAAVLLIGTW